MGGPRISGNREVGGIYELVGSGGIWGDGHLGWGPGVMEVKGSSDGMGSKGV